MKTQPSFISRSLSVLGVLTVLLLPSLDSVAQSKTENIPASKAPTGIYISVTSLPTKFTVHLGTNGEYQVRAESGIVSLSQSQHGRWKWDERRQEFLLTSATNSTDFGFVFRRLRVDPYHADSLQWIPGRGSGSYKGTIEYIRFQRQKEQ